MTRLKKDIKFQKQYCITMYISFTKMCDATDFVQMGYIYNIFLFKNICFSANYGNI